MRCLQVPSRGAGGKWTDDLVPKAKRVPKNPKRVKGVCQRGSRDAVADYRFPVDLPGPLRKGEGNGGGKKNGSQVPALQVPGPLGATVKCKGRKLPTFRLTTVPCTKDRQKIMVRLTYGKGPAHLPCPSLLQEVPGGEVENSTCTGGGGGPVSHRPFSEWHMLPLVKKNGRPFHPAFGERGKTIPLFFWVRSLVPELQGCSTK